MQDERIVAAAVRFNGLTVSLPPPARHCDLVGPIYDETGDPVAPSDQGFLTSTGRFVGRREATSVAALSGQLEKDPKWPPFLYSEDLW